MVVAGFLFPYRLTQYDRKFYVLSASLNIRFPSSLQAKVATITVFLSLMIHSGGEGGIGALGQIYMGAPSSRKNICERNSRHYKGPPPRSPFAPPLLTQRCTNVIFIHYFYFKIGHICFCLFRERDVAPC